MKRNRKQWLKLVLVLMLMITPLQGVLGAQTVANMPDCMSTPGMGHGMDQNIQGHDAGSQMKCHDDNGKVADTCAPDCSDCKTCAGTAALSFSQRIISTNLIYLSFIYPPEASRLLVLPSELRPPRV